MKPTTSSPKARIGDAEGALVGEDVVRDRRVERLRETGDGPRHLVGHHGIERDERDDRRQNQAARPARRLDDEEDQNPGHDLRFDRRGIFPAPGERALGIHGKPDRHGRAQNEEHPVERGGDVPHG
jgi:hypothetical protein